MKPVLLFISILFIFFSCKSSESGICGLGGSIIINPSFRLGNFPGFLDTINNKPFELVIRDSTRVYSPNYKYYFEIKKNYDAYQEQLNLYSGSHKLVCVLKGQFSMHKLAWLKNAVILENIRRKKNKIVVVDLSTGKKNLYKINRPFEFVGNYKSKAYYSTYSFDNKIDGKKVKGRYSIILLSEKGSNIEFSNDSYKFKMLRKFPNKIKWGWDYFSKDTITLTHYSTPILSLKEQKLEEYLLDGKKLNTFFIHNSKVINWQDTITYFNAFENSFNNDTSNFILLNSSVLYRITPTLFEKVIDLKDLGITSWVREFRIENHYLIFLTQENNYELLSEQDKVIQTRNGLKSTLSMYGHNTLGIVNLITKDVIYPKITNK